MTRSDQSRPNDLPGNPQPLVGFMTNEEWDELVAHVNALIEEMEKLPLPKVQGQIFELLNAIDAMHREALRRLVRLFKEGVLEQVVTDPAIHTLMEIYDLLPPASGSEVAASENRENTYPNIPVKIAPAGRNAPQNRPGYPHWVPVLKEAGDLAPGAVKEFNVDDRQVLLCRVEEKFFALDSQCAQDGASMGESTLERYTLTCPSHSGCHYDVRQGTRIAAAGEIRCFPVKIMENGSLLVGLDMEFNPSLPSF